MASAEGVRIRFAIAGAERFDMVLARAQEGVKDLRPAWKAIRPIILDAVKQQFATEGGHASGGWAKLSDRYGKWKAKHFPGKPILQRTGAMYRSLTDPGDENCVYTGTAHSLSYTSLLEYVHYHQEGTGNMPARPPVQFTDADRTKIINEAAKAIQAQMFHRSGVGSGGGVRMGRPAGIRQPSWAKYAGGAGPSQWNHKW